MAEAATSEARVPAVACRGLQRSYGDVRAVSDVSFEVAQGEFFALLGPNGAGKTTTIRMLATLATPSAGEARVLGYDTVREAQQVRDRIGMVFQEPALDERLTARENLTIHAALYAIPRREVDAGVGEALAWAQLTDAAGRPVRTFSGGMKRRLELARALMHGPRLLFLDEPTLGLDPQGRRHLWERIATLRDRGLTVLMTTHNLVEAEACDRVGIIDRGELIALGSPAELRSRASVPDDASLEDVFLELTGRQLRDEEASPRARLLSFGRRGGEHTR